MAIAGVKSACIRRGKPLDTRHGRTGRLARFFVFACKGAEDDTLMQIANPLKFLREVRQEVSKVSWPSRNETLISTVMVIVLAILASIFFLIADGIISWGVQLMLSIR
jgi:preprotein translocase subunit SecE